MEDSRLAIGPDVVVFAVFLQHAGAEGQVALAHRLAQPCHARSAVSPHLIVLLLRQSQIVAKLQLAHPVRRVAQSLQTKTTKIPFFFAVFRKKKKLKKKKKKKSKDHAV